MAISAERRHLLGKTVQKNINAIEILACTLVTTACFIFVYLIMASKFRYSSGVLAWILGPGVIAVLALSMIGAAMKTKRSMAINLAVCTCGALIVGIIVSEQNYWWYLANGYTYRDLVSYVDIVPGVDKGQSYMDSGHVYFKEHSYVNKANVTDASGKKVQMFHKFKNGDNYCVAPIARGPMKAVKGSKVQMKNGFVIPESGSYDWWAVGTNCCDGAFTCGQATDTLARSGMRLLSEMQRPFYVLAVQEWSAKTGLPVKHPLFFEWVQDPLMTTEKLDDKAESRMWLWIGYVALGGLIVSFLIHMFLFRNKIY